MQRFLTTARTLLRNRAFLELLVCNVLLGLTYSFVGPFMSLFGTQEVKMSNAVFGVFMTISSVTAIVLSTWLAHWSDTRYSRRSMLLLGSVCGILGYVGYAFVRDVVWITVIGSVILGISSITFSQLFAYSREMLSRSEVSPTETPLYMNVFRLFFSLAWTVGPALASWVMIHYSFRGTFLAAAAVFALFLVAIWKYVPYAPPFVGGKPAEALPLHRALTRPGLLAHFLAFTLIFTATTISMVNLPLLVTADIGGTMTHVGIIYSLAPVFELPFMFFFGMLATRGNNTRLIRFSFILAVVYFAGLSLVRAPWHVYPLQIVSAAMISVVSGIAITFFQDFLPDQVGTATNVYSNAMRVGGTAGYLLFAALAEPFGHRAVFVFCTGMCLVATGILYFYRKPCTAAAPTAA